jgi:Fe-S-cluster containining protein
LRFSCTACGHCCRGGDERDTVFVNPHEEAAIACHLGLSAAQFRQRYTSTDGDGQRVLAATGDACVFLDQGRCAIYPARPVQCRTWPFWPENLIDAAAWEAVVAECPGAGSGHCHRPAVIQRAVAALARSDRGEAVAATDIPDLSAAERANEHEDSSCATDQ